MSMPHTSFNYTWTPQNDITKYSQSKNVEEALKD